MSKQDGFDTLVGLLTEMNTCLADIAAAMDKKGREKSALESPLAEIGNALADAVALMEKSEKREKNEKSEDLATPIRESFAQFAQTLTSAIQGIRFEAQAPAVNITVPEAKMPMVHVNVPPAPAPHVEIIQQPRPISWKVEHTYDPYGGRITSSTLTPNYAKETP